MKIKFEILLGLSLLLSGVIFAQAPATPAPAAAPAQAPLTEKEVLAELKKQPDQLQKDLSARGVDFEMDADVEKRLRKAKANDAVISAVRQAGPKERAEAMKAQAVAGGGLALSPEEGTDYRAIQGELDPDKAIALCDAFAKKYPNSAALTYVYAFQAKAYQSKGDVQNIVDATQKSLALKKDNIMSLLMAAYVMPQRQYIQPHEANEEQILTQAEGYCQEAFKALDTLKKPAAEDDASFARDKADYSAMLHADLGMIHLDRAQMGLMSIDMAEVAKGQKEYQQAVAMASHPDPADYFRLGESYRLQGKLDDSIAAFTKASQLGQGPLKQLADQQIARLKSAQQQAPAAKQ